MSNGSAKLVDLASVIRSKNASIYHITLDVIFRERKTYEHVKASEVITPGAIADLYGVSKDRVASIVVYDPGSAIKINLRRLAPGGGPGETDVFGSQFADPLYDLEVPAPIS